MTLVIDVFNSLIPPKHKKTPSGWISFNAPCCHHRGHGHDDRQRGGIIYKDGLVYHCFNCGYSTGWRPGLPIGEKLKSLVLWLGGSDDDVKRMVFEALKTEAPDYEQTTFVPSSLFTEKELPEGALPLLDWLDVDLGPENETNLASVVEYVVNRGHDPVDGNFYWTPIPGYSNRVIIPFKFKGKIVGYTARKITHGKPKYLSDQHPNFAFNLDAQDDKQRYVLVCEGPFDALSIGGVALLTNNISDQHARLINSLGKEVIVIPDQDMAGLDVIDKAAELGWSVAFPTWDDNIKDCADAVQKYGKLFVLVDAIKTAQKGTIKINVARNNLEAKLKRLEND